MRRTKKIGVIFRSADIFYEVKTGAKKYAPNAHSSNHKPGNMRFASRYAVLRLTCAKIISVDYFVFMRIAPI